MDREVLVCIAELVWSQSHRPERREKFFYYVNDGKKCVYSNAECITIKELAEEIHEGIFLSESLSSEDKIIYKPPVLAEMISIDGYFGRQAVPVEAYYYKPLKRKQRKELESHLAKLRASCEKINS